MMIPPSENAIALFLSRTSSNRNRAILYLGISDGNVDDAVALFNSKPDESFSAALSRSAVQFRRPLANGARGYEDKYGVIHLETPSEDGNDEDIEAVSDSTGAKEHIGIMEYGDNILCTTGGEQKIREPKFFRPITEHPPLRVATSSEHDEALGTMSRSGLGGKIAIESTKKREKKKTNRDSTFEPEEISAHFDQMSPTNINMFPQRRHRGRYARELKQLESRALGTADDGKPISARTRRSTSFKKVARLPGKSQCSRPKRVTVVTPPPTPRTRNPNSTTPATPPCRSAQLQSSEEYEPYSTPQNTMQSRYKQAKKITYSVANLRTPLSSNAFGIGSYPTPVSIPSRTKTSRIRFNTSNHQRPSEEILPSTFHRSSFECISPLAMKFNYYNKSKTHHNQRDTSETLVQNLDHNNSNKNHCRQCHPFKIPLQDPYIAQPSPISNFSFHSAMNLAREKKRWLLINIQSGNMPACGALDRKLWRHPDIANIVSQSFLFLQLDQSDERVESYLGIYYEVFDLDEEGEVMVCNHNNRKFLRLPHIALLDPVSGHRWKVWGGPGLPDRDLFLADLCEYEMIGEGGWCEWGKGVIRERD